MYMRECCTSREIRDQGRCYLRVYVITMLQYDGHAGARLLESEFEPNRAGRIDFALGQTILSRMTPVKSRAPRFMQDCIHILSS